MRFYILYHFYFKTVTDSDTIFNPQHQNIEASALKSTCESFDASQASHLSVNRNIIESRYCCYPACTMKKLLLQEKHTHTHTYPDRQLRLYKRQAPVQSKFYTFLHFHALKNRFKNRSKDRKIRLYKKQGKKN